MSILTRIYCCIYLNAQKLRWSMSIWCDLMMNTNIWVKHSTITRTVKGKIVLFSNNFLYIYTYQLRTNSKEAASTYKKVGNIRNKTIKHKRKIKWNKKYLSQRRMNLPACLASINKLNCRRPLMKSHFARWLCNEIKRFCSF